MIEVLNWFAESGDRAFFLLWIIVILAWAIKR